MIDFAPSQMKFNQTEIENWNWVQKSIWLCNDSLFFRFRFELARNRKRHHEGKLGESHEFMTTKSHKLDTLPIDFHETCTLFNGVLFVCAWFFLLIVCQWKKIDFVSASNEKREEKKWLNFILRLMKFTQLHWKSIAWFLLLFIQSPNSVYFCYVPLKRHHLRIRNPLP